MKTQHLLAASLLWGAATASQAALVSIGFGGFVGQVDDGTHILGGLSPNGTSTRFTGGLTWDTSVVMAGPGGQPDPAGGIAHGAVVDMWFDFGNGLQFHKQGPQNYNNVQLRNDGTDYGDPAFDGFYAYSQWGNDQFYYTELGLSLQSLDLSALLTGAVLPDGLDLGKFLDPNGLVGEQLFNGLPIDKQGAGIEFHAVKTNPVDETRVTTDLYGVIDQVGRLPEPASLALVGLGLCAAGIGRRKR